MAGSSSIFKGILWILYRQNRPWEAKISSFDSEIDLIGDKEGYGLGDYRLFDASDELGLGDDFREILSYFKARRRDGKLNLKSDISPAAFKDYLPWIALLEPIWDERGNVVNARVTLHGSAAAAAYSNVTGKLVRDVHKPEVANRVVASLDAANTRRAGVIGISEERLGPPPHVRLNILYLPVTLDGEQITHFFAYGRLDRLEDHK